MIMVYGYSYGHGHGHMVAVTATLLIMRTLMVAWLAHATDLGEDAGLQYRHRRVAQLDWHHEYVAVLGIGLV